MNLGMSFTMVSCVTTELDFMEETLKYPYYRVDCASWKIVIEISNKSPIPQNPKCYNFNPHFFQKLYE